VVGYWTGLIENEREAMLWRCFKMDVDSTTACVPRFKAVACLSRLFLSECCPRSMCCDVLRIIVAIGISVHFHTTVYY